MSFPTLLLNFASSKPTGVDQADETEEDYNVIQANIIPGAQTILELFTSNQAAQIITHGCWCKQFDETNEELVGGNAVDDVDRLCKDWKSKRTCESSCDSESTNYYMLEYNETHFSCLDTDDCLKNTCLIDSYYADQIAQLINLDSGSSWEASPSTTCDPIGSSTIVSESNRETVVIDGDQSFSSSASTYQVSNETSTDSCDSLSPDLSSTSISAEITETNTAEETANAQVEDVFTDLNNDYDYSISVEAEPIEEQATETIDDIDECQDISLHNCTDTQLCINNISNYTCETIIVQETENNINSLWAKVMNRHSLNMDITYDSSNDIITLQNATNEYETIIFSQLNIDQFLVRCPFGNCQYSLGFVTSDFCDESLEQNSNTCETLLTEKSLSPYEAMTTNNWPGFLAVTKGSEGEKIQNSDGYGFLANIGNDVKSGLFSSLNYEVRAERKFGKNGNVKFFIWAPDTTTDEYEIVGSMATRDGLYENLYWFITLERGSDPVEVYRVVYGE